MKSGIVCMALLAACLALCGAADGAREIEIGTQKNEAPVGEKTLVEYDVALHGFADYGLHIDVAFSATPGEAAPEGIELADVSGAPTDKTLTLRVTPEAQAGTYAFALCVEGTLSAPDGLLVVGGPIEAEELTACCEETGLQARARYAMGGRFERGASLALSVEMDGSDALDAHLALLDAQSEALEPADRLSVTLSLPADWTGAQAALVEADGHEKSLHATFGAGGISFVMERTGTVRVTEDAQAGG